MLPTRLRTVLLFLLLILVTTAAFGQRAYDEGGYADRHSVVAGNSIAFHIATSVSPFSVEIVNMASPHSVIQTVGGLMSQRRDCTGMWESGCGWPVTHLFTVPITWVPGYYVARFPTSQGTKQILFVVRPAVTGSYAPIALVQPSNSDVAYNRFGGKSVYDTISDDGHRAHVVSFDRPYYEDSGLARFNIWEEKFVAWMKAENRKFEVITDDDMEAGIDLSPYKALVIVGHSEYWSLKARRHLEAYSRAGGHVAIFGANTMWWQVRVDLQARTMTVYKDATLDPMTGVDDDLVTTNFFDWPVLNPENRILGASFLNAAYVNKLNSSDRLPMEQRTPYTVRKASHWSLEGTGLTNGATFGRSVGAIEVDGALFNTLPDGSVETEGSDGTPLSYEVLATLPSSDGYATIGMYVNAQGGAVYNGAARDWSYGLLDDAIVQRITRNVLDRLGTGEPFAYQPRVTPNRAEDRFNTPKAAQDFLPGWRFHRFGLDLTPRCAYEGPFGLELTGPRWTLILRHVDVGRTGLNKAAANVWLNADLLESSPGFATALLGFVDYQGANRPYSGVLEWMKRPEGNAVRMASYDDGVQVTRTDWVIVPPGWHSVQFAWESPGMLEVNVSGKKARTFNPQSGQKMNALMIEFAGSAASGSVCMDHLQFRDAFAPASRHISSLSAAPSTIAADKTSSIIVQLYDADGQPLVNGGDSVALTTDMGSLSPVTDHGDGMYTATFTPDGASGTATIRGTVNGQNIVDTTSVTILPPPPPAAPTALAATAASATRIDLLWTDNATTESGFRIERCSGAGCTSFAEIAATPSNVTAYADTTVAGDTTYLYRVFATNGGGDSAPSNSAGATTPAACMPPTIHSQPQSKTANSGAKTTLSVGASGTSLSYQWFAGTTAIDGADESTLTVSPTATTTYFVRVTNACGTADSAAATITVREPGNAFYVITPCRVIDTRYRPPALASGQTRVVQVTGTCGIPAGATAVAVNVTAVGPTTTGWLSLYPTGVPWPRTATLNYRAAKTRANSSIVTLSKDGQTTVLNNGATLNFVIDATGYFQ